MRARRRARDGSAGRARHGHLPPAQRGPAAPPPAARTPRAARRRPPPRRHGTSRAGARFFSYPPRLATLPTLLLALTSETASILPSQSPFESGASPRLPPPAALLASPSGASPGGGRRGCAHCASSFVSKAHLAIHVRTVHERQRVHVCDYDGCGKTFGQRGSLSRHVSAVHLQIRKHACPHPGCGKSFSERWTLSVHVVRLMEDLWGGVWL